MNPSALMTIILIKVGPLGANCYLLGDNKTGRCGIIDPGGEVEKICSALRETGFIPCCILLTHGHFDHTSAVRPLLEKYPGLPVYIHPEDTDGAEHFYHFIPVSGQRYYKDGDKVKIGELTIRILETPGHSRGSVCLRVEDALFCGDTLFDGSCGRTDLPGGDQAAMDRTLARLARLPEKLGIFPGHMGESTLGDQFQTNPFLRQMLP